MVSKSCFALNWKTLPLLLIVFTVFTVSLTENLQLADGLSAYSMELLFELDVGETQMLTWGIVNTNDDPINIEFYATGEGSEFLVFEDFAVLPGHSVKELEIFVSIPKDHPNNIEYRPTIFALQRGTEMPDGGAGMRISVQMENTPKIKIGDNAIYTPPVIIPKTELPTENPKVKENPVPVEVVPEETLEEKMAKIKESNQPTEVKVDDTFEESFEEEAVPELQVDDSYIEEPIADVPAITDSATVEKVECGFIDWILSLFGMAKC